MSDATSEVVATAVPVLKHYVVWYGAHWNDIYDNPVESRDPAKYIMHEHADHFRIYDRLELEWEHEGDIIKLRSDQFNFSPFYVPGGQLLTDEERTEAFATDLRPYAIQQNDYTVFRTRHRDAVPVYLAVVEFPPLS